ncbi:MAG: SH3 domain-containing protein [Pseudopelagicola sp.]|nr:SH3 domain-containing protein [Pseudopelagicola sp.]
MLPALHHVVNVAPNDVLNIRSAPNASAPVIGTLAPDANDIEVVAADETGQWGRINSGERSGWVSLRFMQTTANGHWKTPSATLSCFGTEPFWSLFLSPKAKRADFARPDTAPVSTKITQFLISAPGFPASNWAVFDKGTLKWAQMQQASCNDGMSDRAFGISIKLAVSQPMNNPLTPPIYTLAGCCSVVPDR